MVALRVLYVPGEINNGCSQWDAAMSQINFCANCVCFSPEANQPGYRYKVFKVDEQ